MSGSNSRDFLLDYCTLCSFERTAFARRMKSQTSGDHAVGVPPVPIPNTEVKTSRAKDTWSASSWESRSSPGNKQKTTSNEVVFLCYLMGQNAGVPPVRSTLQEYASWVAVWRKAHPPFVYRTRKLRPPGPIILGAQAPGNVGHRQVNKQETTLG